MKKKVKDGYRACCYRVLFLLLLELALMIIVRNSTTTSIVRLPLPTTTTDINYAQGHEYKRWRPTATRQIVRRRNSSIDSPPISHLSVQSLSHIPKPQPAITCDRSHQLYDWCHLKRATILEPTKATFYTLPLSEPAPYFMDDEEEKVRPYPRKTDRNTMSRIKEITFTTKRAPSLNINNNNIEHKNLPPLSCQVNHNSPALVFSIGGFTGNFFHDFNDGFIPLFITINTLFPHHQQNNNITLVISDFSEWWYSKYEAILPQFTSNPIINLDNQTATRCFPSVAAGLITHGPMTISEHLIPNNKSFLDFRSLLEEGYRRCLVWPPPKVKGRPRLVLVSRKGTGIGRVILNEQILVRTAQEQGFEVILFEPNVYTYLCDVYRLINSSHVMIGVHGAALTHSLFLRPGAVFIQVVPLGIDWLADKYFKNLGKGMGLEYMEYKIRGEESSLVEKYGMDHEIVKKAMDIVGHNWSAQHLIYLREQDVRIDVGRFRGFLKKAYVKAVGLMRQQGLRVIRQRGHKNSRFKTFVQPLVFQ